MKTEPTVCHKSLIDHCCPFCGRDCIDVGVVQFGDDPEIHQDQRCDGCGREWRVFYGPVGIVQMSGQAAQFGWVAIVQFMAFLSISLGLINLFPVPMLDGGHLLFYAYEAVRGRPLGARSQEYGFRIGLALVVMLMLFATWNDLVHLQVVSYVLELFS